MEVPQTLPVGIESYETDPAYNKSRVLAYRRWLASTDTGINPKIFVWIPGAAELYEEPCRAVRRTCWGRSCRSEPGASSCSCARLPPARSLPAS